MSDWDTIRGGKYMRYPNIITSGQTYSGVATVDVTNFNYEIYLLIHTVFWGYTGNGSITFDKVWLE